MPRRWYVNTSPGRSRATLRTARLGFDDARASVGGLGRRRQVLGETANAARDLLFEAQHAPVSAMQYDELVALTFRPSGFLLSRRSALHVTRCAVRREVEQGQRI